MNASSPRNFVPLTDADRRVLRGRDHLLTKFMKFFYGALLAGLTLFALKSVVSRGAVEREDMLEIVSLAALIGGTLVACHALLAWFERHSRQDVRADLAGGVKVRKSATLAEVRAGTEGEPTYLQFRDASTDEVQELALRTLQDLRRIEPDALVGKSAEVEYAPRSGIVLALRRQPAA